MSLESFLDTKHRMAKELSDWLKEHGAEEGQKTHETKDGRRYLSVVSGGEKTEGKPFPVFCGTPEIAQKLWIDTVLDMFPGLDTAFKSATVAVRCWPELHRFPVVDLIDLGYLRDVDSIPVTYLYSVYSRLAAKA